MVVHRNLLRLCGFCRTQTERLLVYPFMVNGSVASRLRERPESQPPLDWPIRKRIALGAAKGLAYLHEYCDPMIIPRDVKAANILLDEEFEALVGDFGLAKLKDYNDTHVTTLRAFDLERHVNDDDEMLLDWVKGLMKDKRLETLMDADLQGNYNVEEVEPLIQVALLCTQSSLEERPKMSAVIRMLGGYVVEVKWDEWESKEVIKQDFNHTHHDALPILEEKWNEGEDEEVIQQDFNHIHHNTANCILDSTSNMALEELSGSR